MNFMRDRKTIQFLSIIIIFSIFLTPSVISEDENVTDETFTTIQEAIDATFEGDTVYIYGGEYVGDIIVNKSLTLEGKSINGYNPTIVGNLTVAADNVTISNLIIKNGSGIVIKGFIGTGYSNIIYYNNTIKNNIILNSSSYGIYLYWAYYTNITGNTIKNNEKGIRLQYAGYNNIYENTIENNKQDGIYCAYSWENSFYKNIIQRNKHGFYFDFYFDENKIYENTITNNTEFGIYHLLDNNIPNTIFHNNFIKNTKHVFDGGKNYWNDSQLKEGNYWDNYTGKDLNPQDGIGDSPYDIFGSNIQDNFPLMSPYSGRITLEKYIVNEDTVQLMLVVGIIVVIIFCIPIGLWWRKKYFK